MNCPEVMELMNRFLDNDLNEIETTHLMEHLEQCEDCSDMFERLRHLSLELENIPKVVPKYSIVDAILPQLELIELSKEKEVPASAPEEPKLNTIIPPKSRRKSRFPFITIGGVIAAGLVVGIFITNYKADTMQQADMELSSSYSADQSVEKAEQSVESAAVEADSTRKDVTTQSASSASTPASGGNQETPVDPGSSSSKMAIAETPKEDAKNPAVQDEKAGKADANPPKAADRSKGSGTETTPAPNKKDVKAETHKDDSNNSENRGLAGDQKVENNKDGSNLMGSMLVAVESYETDSADGHMEVTAPSGGFKAVFDKNQLIVYDADNKEVYKQTLKAGSITNVAWSKDSATLSYDFTARAAEGQEGKAEKVTIQPKS